MSVLVVSDLHLDRWLLADLDPFLALPTDLLASVERLIVAFDLSNKPKVWWPHMISFLTQYVPADRVYLVPGNHDYYDHVIDGDDRLAEIFADAGVNYAHKAAVVISGTRFLCCTLWTDFALHGHPARAMIEADRFLISRQQSAVEVVSSKPDQIRFSRSCRGYTQSCARSSY